MELDSLQQLRELPAEDLQQKSAAIRKELFTLRINQVSARVERPSQFRALRRQLARMMTLLGERERQPQSAAPSEPKTGSKKRAPARKKAGAKDAS